MPLASVQPALIPETLKMASGFKKWLMIGTIPDIEGRKFEESAIQFIHSYPLPYHLSPINTSYFMEEGDGNSQIWEQCYVVGLSIEARDKEDQGEITFNKSFVTSWYMKEYMCFPL